VPSEITLLAAGFAVHQGRLPFAAAVAAATAGNLVGSLIAYALGRLSARWMGARWRIGPRAQAALRRCDAMLARRGGRAVFTTRLMPLARTFISLPAGHARIGIVRFIALTALGCAIWASGFVLAGTLLGASWQRAGNDLRIPLLGVAAVAVTAVLLHNRKRLTRPKPNRQRHVPGW
jgi:membrane protein DedA with SNARE-associated domain